MSMLSEQVKELRQIGKRQRSNAKISEKVFLEIEKAFLQAADTIEALSAKLTAANMERSDRYYGGDRKLEAGDIVQHFKRETVKDKEHSMEYLYIIEAIASHTETNEKLVVYRALHKDDEKGVHFNVFARPYDMFMAEVDHEKYPDIKQNTDLNCLNMIGVDCIAGIYNYSYLFNRRIERQAVFKVRCIHRYSEYGRRKWRGV